jgi:AraC-like DNA-binding protein
MASEHVRMWRPAEQGRVLMMAGQTTHYAVEPRGEYVFGVITARPMRSRRGRERRLVRPGQLLAWDPSHAHAGSSADGAPWSARLMVVELPGLHALAGDAETAPLVNVAFPEPVLSAPDLVRDFLRLHRALESPGSRLEHDELLAEWLRSLIERFSTAHCPPSRFTQRDDRALRLACDYLADCPERNVGLDELAAASGIGKFRLIRLFRDRTGLPPHTLHIAHRIRVARRLLEAGHTIAHTATATGFADQPHLHRHFQRSLGMTPAQYQHRFTGSEPLHY